jgi:hypothetical protein
MHDANSIQKFFDKLVNEGWDILWYNEINQSSGVLSSSPQEINLHITVVCGKRQSNIL